LSGLPKILITGPDLAEQARNLLNEYELVYAGSAPFATPLLDLCRRHNPKAIIVRYGHITAAMMDAAPALKVISKHGSGIDTIDVESAKTRGVAVVAATAVNAYAVAEHALGLMLAAAKSIPALHDRMVNAHWDKATHKSIELRGKTIGLIGLGAIGLRFASLCKALGMHVLGYDPYANVDACQHADIQLLTLAELLPIVDVLSLHCPLTNDNHEIINAERLAQCKHGMILINTARGGLINEGALLAAIETGQVSTAALDCFAIEPIATSHPFQSTPGFILSPHIGGVTRDAYVNMGMAAAENCLRMMSK
jgi:D-3-phosphoglycerate dehydrogenase / 2-oxoglutarate reductase